MKIKCINPSKFLIDGEIYGCDEEEWRDNSRYIYLTAGYNGGAISPMFYKHRFIPVEETLTKFEVGKIYKKKDLHTKFEFKVIGHSSKGYPVVEYFSSGTIFPWMEHPKYENYEEVVPKETGKFFVNVYADGSSAYTWKSRKEADENQKINKKRIACIEVNWTEGDGL